jgi:hypothetical protein
MLNKELIVVAPQANNK